MRKLLLILAFATFVLAGCATAKRGNIVAVRDIPSPDGRYVCTVFGEIFYDTTGYPQHIDLHRANEKRNYPGNLCIVPVGTDVSAAWTSPTNLFVRLHFETQREIPAATNVTGITVTFSEMVR